MSFLLKVRRAETPFYAWLKRLALGFLRFDIPALRVLAPVLRVIRVSNSALYLLRLRLQVIFYRAPLFRSSCVSVGKNLYLELLPSISSHTRVTVGDDVYISGAFSINSARVFEQPELIIGNRVFIGHQVAIVANQKVVIEDNVLIARGCYIADSDQHPIDRDLRASGAPAPAESTRAVRICRDAWIGQNSMILKGVTIGEGAIVGAASVVRTDVPPFCVAAGNPAQIVRRLQVQ